jgi:hypothetical protein
METAGSSETYFAIYHITRHNPEDQKFSSAEHLMSENL